MDIFLDAIDLSPVDRTAFLVERCGGDDALRAEVEGLLAAHAGSEDVFGLASAHVPGLESGDRIGPYELIEEIGEGGFAVVWKARQEVPLRRTVALKVLKAGLETRQILARFEAERHALAMMEHPGIAKVLDGGVTDAGRPWFAMELVDGPPITEHCDRRRLDKRGRLELFREVCRAVQHAHQKGVVHRDLKPSNILVATVDGRSVPKVIDFGIAKAIERPLGGATALTLEGQVVGTPAYMSPEQVDETIDVDTRADVYALGVLLYELLCGQLPFADDTLRAAGLAEILRIICEEEPPRPSTRRTTAHVLPREIRGDLDWIVMRCLEKDRERRYDSAGILGGEIERHLGGEPVLAGPPDFAYRARKFASRNRTALAFAVTVALLLVAGIIASLALLVRARAAEQRKDVELAKLTEISAFFQSILTGVDPAVAQGEDTTLLLKVLEASADSVDEQLGDQPEVEATVRNAMGAAFMSIGRADRAESEFRRALELRRATMGPDEASVHVAAQELGTLLMTEGRIDEADALLVSSSAELERLLGPDDERTLRAVTELATLRRHQGDLDASEELHRDAAARIEAALGPRHELTIKCINNLAALVQDQGDLDEALTRYTRALELQREVHDRLHPDALIALNNVGGVLRRMGRYADALPYVEEALELKLEVLPEGHPSLFVAYNNVAMLKRGLGEIDDALDLFGEAQEMAARTRTEGTPNAISLRYNHAMTLERAGRDMAALELFESGVESAATHYGPDHPVTLEVEGALGWQLARLGQYEDAAPILVRVLETLDEVAPDDLGNRGIARVRAGYVDKELGDRDLARTRLEEGRRMIEEGGPAMRAEEWVAIAGRALEGLQ
ncbi:MAG: serine/threonine-protein kinase [Planctomycetota bacterium]